MLLEDIRFIVSIKQHTKINRVEKNPSLLKLQLAMSIFTAGIEIRILIPYPLLVVRGYADM